MSSLWTFTTLGWVIIHGVSWWVVESVIGSFCTTNSTTFWCYSLISALFVAFVFGAFTNSPRTGCCLTCYNCFLRLLVTILNIFWNHHGPWKPLHYFWIIILFFQTTPPSSQKFVLNFFYRSGAYLFSKTLH